MEIYYQYVRLRKQFGRHPRFVDEGAEMLADIRPNEEHAQACIPKNPVVAVCQCVAEVSEHEANTNAVTFASKAMSHVEGGWPKDVDHSEAEHTIRYRKKVEKDEDYIHAVAALGAAVEGLVKMNNAVDIYQQYFAGYAADHSAEVPAAKTVTVFRDPSAVPRDASCIDWHPDGLGKAVIAYSVLAFQQQPANMPLASYVWDVASPNTPETELLGPSQLVCARFNVKDANLVGAGAYNGQLALFDVRKGAAPVELTSIDISHRDPLCDLAWLQSKTGSEAMTVSTDGQVMVWDCRKLSEAVETMPLKEKGSEELLGGVALEYDPTAGPTKFMVGTEQGAVLNCNRKAKNPADRVGTSYTGHHGPVVGVHRNPFFPKYFLTLGDWTARVWNEDLRSPLLTGRYNSAYITGGGWSPTRPGVYFTTHASGALQVWDLGYKHSEPTLQVAVTDQPLTSFAIQGNGRTLGLCTEGGACHVLSLSAGLVEMAANEKQGVNALFERETLREKNLEKAQKEAKVKARKEAAKKDESSDTFTDQQLHDLEEGFFSATGLAGATGLASCYTGDGDGQPQRGGEDEAAAGSALSARSSLQPQQQTPGRGDDGSSAPGTARV